jgi:hypothetical protein
MNESPQEWILKRRHEDLGVTVWMYVALFTASGTVAGAPSTKVFRLRLVFRLQKGASHDLGHSMPRFRLVIYQLKTNWRHSAAFQKSTLLVWLEMMPPKPGPRHFASRNRVALRR